MITIDKTAIIEDGVELGKDISVGAYSIIKKGVKIGDGTSIATHCIIEGNTTIGKNNQIFSHAALGTIPQDLKYNGEEVELIIGDNNKIREFTLFNPGTMQGGGVTKIGDGNLFMGYTHVAHDCIIGNGCIFANVATLAGHVQIDDFVVVGGLSAIHQFCKIGTQSMIGGGSIVVQDIPPFCNTEGNRATIRGLNLTGLRRRLNNREDINEIKKAYKELFESGQPLQDTAKTILENTTNSYVKSLVEFIINTKRGIPFIRK
jgi:UDP-N-acetylglucosamine acyltransferase